MTTSSVSSQMTVIEGNDLIYMSYHANAAINNSADCRRITKIWRPLNYAEIYTEKGFEDRINWAYKRTTREIRSEEIEDKLHRDHRSLTNKERHFIALILRTRGVAKILSVMHEQYVHALKLLQEGLKADSLDSFKEYFVNQNLNPNILECEVSHNEHHFYGTLLSILCWHGKIESVRWLLSQSSHYPLCLNSRWPAFDDAITAVAISPLVPVQVKIEIIRIFPVGSVNPFLRHTLNNGEFALISENPYDLRDDPYSLMEPEVLQCLLERGMAECRHESYRIVSTGPYVRTRSITDDLIKREREKWLSFSSTYRKMAALLVANGIFPLEPETHSENLRLMPDFCERKALCELKGPAVEPRHIDFIFPPHPLLELVCEYHGGDFLTDSRTFYMKVCANEEGQKGQKLAWSNERWERAPTPGSKNTLLPERLRLTAIHQANQKHAAAFHDLVTKRICVFKRLESLSNRPSDEDNREKIQLLQQALGILDQLVQPPQPPTAATASAATSAAPVPPLEERMKQLDQFAPILAEAMEQYY